MIAVEEEWRPVEGYPHYEVSDCGRVRSYVLSGGWVSRESHAICPREQKTGYFYVHLYTKGSSKHVLLAKLVASAFLGTRPVGMQINHKDGVKANNCASNLEYVTPSENHRHALAIGLLNPVVGEEHGNSKLTDDEVMDIRHLYADGAGNQYQLGRQFGVSQAEISRIVKRKIWRHI